MMKVTLKKRCGDLELTIEAEGKDEKEIWPQLGFWSALPTAHPSGATDFQIRTRPATTAAGKTVHYHEIVCPSAKQRFALGQGTEGGLFPKGWENLYGPGELASPDSAPPPPSPPAPPPSSIIKYFAAKPLTENELKARATRLATGTITYDATSKSYLVPVNDKTSYKVSEGPVCNCERFSTAAEPGFRCEHIRAVAIWIANTGKINQRHQLELLIKDLQKAQVADEEIQKAIARVCDGVCEVSDLTAEQIPKALRTLQVKYTNLAVVKQLAAA